MKKITVVFYILFLLAQNNALAQNWDAFNKNYRYNYKYDNSQLVSQVLFADSVKIAGTDTVYALNRIGVKCAGSCPGLSIAPTTTETVIVPNMPQFLQRQVRKYSDGRVMFRDTAKLVINPFCQVNQSWLFDSINNKTALCFAKTGQTIFGISDTVKYILIDATDTLKLSKHFGIIQFPNLYNKNKYYRLAGIEAAAGYDSIPLYGEKVPNAWDFYNFQPGDRFCYRKRLEFTLLTQRKWWCTIGNFTIKNKVIAGNSYVYTVEESWENCPINPSYWTNGDSPGSSTVRSYTNLSSPLFENKMYPGQVIKSSYLSNPAYEMVRFGKNTAGTFFKYTGRSCNGLDLPPESIIDYGFVDTPNGYLTTGFKRVVENYGVGLGVVDRTLWESGTQQDYCQTCAVKSGTLYHGTETFVGIKEQIIGNDSFLLYPNPLQDKVNLRVGNISVDELRITNLLGQTIFTEHKNFRDQETELDLSSEKSGIYLVQLFNEMHLVSSQKLIKN